MMEQSQGAAIDKKESVETIKLTINGKHYELTTGDDIEPWESLSYDVYPWDKLLHTLREKLGLTGTKSSCDRGACGACSVLIDGRLSLSCHGAYGRLRRQGNHYHRRFE